MMKKDTFMVSFFLPKIIFFFSVWYSLFSNNSKGGFIDGKHKRRKFKSSKKDNWN